MENCESFVFDGDMLLCAGEAYAEYASVVGNKNWQGLPMPKFEELPERIKYAWMKAVEQAIQTYEILEFAEADLESELAEEGIEDLFGSEEDNELFELIDKEVLVDVDDLSEVEEEKEEDNTSNERG